MQETITIIGTGYVGLTTAAVLSNVGYKVYTLDIDPKKIEIVKSGKSYFYEVGLDEFISKGIESGNLIPTTSYEESVSNSSVVFSCVGTPDLPDGSSDLRQIFAAAKTFAEYAKDDVVYVQKSTVPVGTGRDVMNAIEEVNNDLKFGYVSNPEFLAESSALYDTLNFDRLVVGSDSKEAKERIIEIFRNLDKFAKGIDFSKYEKFAATYKSKAQNFNKVDFDTRVVNTTLESAELIKVTANAFLALKISFANFIAKVCDQTGADVMGVMDGVGADHRIGRSFLYAGLGWGGGCFPKDVSGLIATAEKYGVDTKIMQAAVDENFEMPDYSIAKLKTKLGDLKDKQIAVLGLSFKPGTSDVRRSQSISLANKLTERGVKVKAFDPEAMEEAEDLISEKVELVDSIEDSIKDSDAVIISTEWPEFMEFDWAIGKDLMRGNLFLDGRNRLDREKMEALGFEYVGIGK